jgi:cytochrome c
VVGRTTGQVAGFRYSAPNKAAALTLDEATLDRYLTKPQAVVPHTIMPYAGLADAGKRADLIAYLVTLH